jgi:uncharacterized protein (DUF697 family)
MEFKKITHDSIMKALEWSYETAVNGGIPGTDTAIELAENYLKKKGTLKQKVNRLIRWQNTKSATTGFLTGLGGIITMPITIPADIAVVLFVQMRMVAAIAHIGGYDLKDDEVKTFVYTCLAGNGAKEILRNTGIELGKKLAISGIKKIPGATLTKINQAVGFRLLTKFGEKGVINLGKLVPLAGGIIGGTVDGISTNIVGNVARNIFIEGIDPKDNKGPEPVIV